MDEEVIKVLKDVRDLLKDIAKKLDRIELNISEREFKSVNPLVLLELPDTLRTTYMVMLKLKEGTAKDVSEITKRGRAIESHYLNTLVNMGYLDKKRVGKRVYFYVK